MKVLKWLAITVGVLILVVGIGVVALVYLVDWNDFRDTIKTRVEAETGRTLEIAGDLNPSVFPWAGISVGEIAFGNAKGFGDTPFARIGSADVKVELLPLLRKRVNVRTVQLNGLELDLQRAEDGSTNWDDLVDTTSTTVKSEEGEGDGTVTTEVEGNTPTIAALAVGGIEFTDANVSWRDAQAGTDAKLSDFDLVTGAIELAKPFDLSVDFAVASESMDINADVTGKGAVTIDLDNQRYTLDGFTMNTKATGAAFPNGKIDATFGANVLAALSEQRIDIEGLSLEALGMKLNGAAQVTDIDTEAAVSATLASETFSPRKLFARLGIAEPVTADESVLGAAAFSMALSATPSSATLDDLVITLDDTTFKGNASVPDLASGAAVPPLRFDFAVDAIDIDRYLPPTVEGDGEAPAEDAPVVDDTGADGDAPIALPMDLLRQLDVDGTFRVGSVKVANLTTKDIVVPLKAKGGKLGLAGLTASLYEGKLDTTASLDATGDVPGYGVQLSLAGIQADPLLADLMQKDSFLSGAGEVKTDIRTSGDTINAIKAGLDGTFDTAFTDGSINGINIGYQLRRAKAALTGQKLADDEKNVKTDFSSLVVGGRFAKGVMTSDNLDMRSPLLRINGAGTVDLPGETVDYTPVVLVTGTAQGQGGADLESLKGVELAMPIRGTFDELAADFVGVLFRGMKENIGGNLKNQAKALAGQEAEKLKAQAAEMAAEKEVELRKKADEAKGKVEEQVKDRLKGLLK